MPFEYRLPQVRDGYVIGPAYSTHWRQVPVAVAATLLILSSARGAEPPASVRGDDGIVSARGLDEIDSSRGADSLSSDRGVDGIDTLRGPG